MRGWGALVAAAGVAAAFASFREPAHPWTLVVAGNTDGYLSPCGCTAPMTGGIRRRATAIRQIAGKGPIVLLDSGNFTNGQGRQSELKAETMAQSVAAMDAAAVGLTAKDARLGPGTVSSMTRLSDHRMIASDIEVPVVEGLQRFAQRGPFLIGSISPGLSDALGAPSVGVDRATRALISNAQPRNRVPVLMLDAPRETAVDLARRFPSLGAIVYRREGWPTEKAERVGRVWLVTPGEHGKALVRLTFDGSELGGYVVTRLGPEFSNDPEVSRLFQTYLRRVSAADLISEIPRVPSAKFAGEKTCAPCHAAAHKVWLGSAHAHALATLEKQGQDRDPDCVPCHVTGLTRESGFLSRKETPQHAFVGCESCHGPSKQHALFPKKFPLHKVDEKVCTTCHTADQSPNFAFIRYWKKILHK